MIETIPDVRVREDASGCLMCESPDSGSPQRILRALLDADVVIESFAQKERALGALLKGGA